MASRMQLLTAVVSTLWMFSMAARAEGQSACAKEATTKGWQRASLAERLAAFFKRPAAK